MQITTTKLQNYKYTLIWHRIESRYLLPPPRIGEVLFLPAYNKSVFSLPRRLSTWRCPRVCCWVPCCGRHGDGRRCCSAPAPAIDRYLLAAGRSAANPPATVTAVDWCDRQTDGRTLDRFIDPAPHTMRAALICIFKYATCLSPKFTISNVLGLGVGSQERQHPRVDN